MFPRKTTHTCRLDTRRVGGKSITKSTRGSARVERISGFRTACVAQTADKISAPQRDQIINISQPENVHKNGLARHQSQLRRRYHRDKTRNYRRDLDTQSKEHTNDISIYFNSARLSRLAPSLLLLLPVRGTQRVSPRYRTMRPFAFCRGTEDEREPQGRIFCATLGSPRLCGLFRALSLSLPPSFPRQL